MDRVDHNERRRMNKKEKKIHGLDYLQNELINFNIYHIYIYKFAAALPSQKHALICL